MSNIDRVIQQLNEEEIQAVRKFWRLQKELLCTERKRTQRIFRENRY